MSDVVVGFCGGGGSSLGVHAALPDAHIVGIDNDRDSCLTHSQAFETIRADMTTHVVRSATGLWMSPPCTDWSSAGKRQGLDGETGKLIFTALEWVERLQPEWAVFEQVRGVLPYWQHFARRLRGQGYNTWAGLMDCADYGVPQNRVRAILLASKLKPVSRPPTTHAKHPGMLLKPWVGMVEALGWDRDDEMWEWRGRGMVERHGGRPNRGSTDPSFTITASGGGGGGGGPKLRHIRAGDRKRSTIRSEEEPAPTVQDTDGGGWRWLVSGQNSTVGDGKQQRYARKVERPSMTITSNGHLYKWADERPATTVMGTPRIFPSTGHHPEQGQGHASNRAVPVTLEELACLQDFPPDWEFIGTKSSRARQIGNAVPPTLARVCVEAVCHHR